MQRMRKLRRFKRITRSFHKLPRLQWQQILNGDKLHRRWCKGVCVCIVGPRADGQSGPSKDVPIILKLNRLDAPATIEDSFFADPNLLHSWLGFCSRQLPPRAPDGFGQQHSVRDRHVYEQPNCLFFAAKCLPSQQLQLQQQWRHPVLSGLGKPQITEQLDHPQPAGHMP